MGFSGVVVGVELGCKGSEGMRGDFVVIVFDEMFKCGFVVVGFGFVSGDIVVVSDVGEIGVEECGVVFVV